jgi:hypothetical protein
MGAIVPAVKRKSRRTWYGPHPTSTATAHAT